MRLYVLHSVRFTKPPPINHLSTSCLLLNLIILTVAYLLQILSPLEAANPKREQPSNYRIFFSFLFNSSWVVLESVPRLSVHIAFTHWLRLLHLDDGTSCTLPLPFFVSLCSTSPPLSGRDWKTRWQRDKGHEVLIVIRVCACVRVCVKPVTERDRIGITEWETCLKK